MCTRSRFPPTAMLKRIEPGQTDLTKAEPLDFSSLAVGDRVLVTLDPNATGATPQAARIIAIKQADVTKKQEAENAAWNQGVHGLVKSVDTVDGRHCRDHAYGPHHQRRHREYHHGDGARALRAGFGASSTRRNPRPSAPSIPATSCGRAEPRMRTAPRLRRTAWFRARSAAFPEP